MFLRPISRAAPTPRPGLRLAGRNKEREVLEPNRLRLESKRRIARMKRHSNGTVGSEAASCKLSACLCLRRRVSHERVQIALGGQKTHRHPPARPTVHHRSTSSLRGGPGPPPWNYSFAVTHPFSGSTGSGWVAAPVCERRHPLSTDCTVSDLCRQPRTRRFVDRAVGRVVT